jgi:hypothetical protein
MVRAILDGRKTMTRRVLKPKKHGCLISQFVDTYILDAGNADWLSQYLKHKVGDILWVREEHYLFGHWEVVPNITTKTGRVKWRFVAHDRNVLFDAPSSFRKGMINKAPHTPAWHKRLARFMPRCFRFGQLWIGECDEGRARDFGHIIFF